MPSRKSTRGKIRYESEKITGHIERILENLHNMDELADGQSRYINDFMPAYVNLFTQIQEQWKQFHEGL